jgi:hypothetical protein
MQETCETSINLVHNDRVFNALKIVRSTVGPESRVAPFGLGGVRRFPEGSICVRGDDARFCPLSFKLPKQNDMFIDSAASFARLSLALADGFSMVCQECF